MAASKALPQAQSPKHYFALPKFNFRFFIQLLSEFLATFIFQFVILGSVMTQISVGNPTSLGQLLTFGIGVFLTITALTYAFGQNCGAHMNPVLTAGLMFSLRMNWIIGLIYIALQFLASTAALGILDALFPMSNIIDKMVVKPPLGETDGGAFFLQFLGATYFIFTYLFFRYDAPNLTITEDMSAVDKKKTKEAQFRFILRQHLTPFVLGFSYAAATLVGVYLNPWSVLVVCMIAQSCGQAWIYCVGGFVGALFGALLFMFLFQFGKPAPKASLNPTLPPVVPEDC